jgi:hypothetical protein
MINSNCDITFENDEISKEITLSCPDKFVTTQSCEVGDLVGGMCVYTICPDGYSDNGSDCIKEIPPVTVPCVGVAGCTYGRRNNNISAPLNIFFSFINFESCDNQQIEATSVFPTLLNAYGSAGQPIQFFLGGVSYSQVVDSVQGSIIYFQEDIFSVAYPNNTFVAGETKKSNTTSGLGIGMTVSQLSSVIFGGTTWIAPNQNTTPTCVQGTTLIDGKCYEVVSKVQTQELPINNTLTVPQIALPQTITVSKGEVLSDISGAHANYLANELLKQKIAAAQPLCQDTTIYENTLINKVGKKECNIGYACDVTVSITAGTFTSTISQEDAQTQAQIELDRRYDLASPCCITPTTYYSKTKPVVVEKTCDMGYTPNPQQLTVTIPEGGGGSYNNIIIPAFTSSLSQEEADSKRDTWVNTNLYLFKNQIQCVKIIANENCAQESSALVMQVDQLQLQVGTDFVWTFIRSSGDWNIDLAQIQTETGQPISGYKMQICTSIPSYIPTIGDLKNVVGDYIYVSNTINELKLQYAIGNQLTIVPGNYLVTLLLRPNTVTATKYYKYGYDNCCS